MAEEKMYTEMDLIKTIATPILDHLLEIQESMGGAVLENMPDVELMISFDMSQADDADKEEMDRFARDLQDYIEEQMEVWYHPTLLN